MLHFSRQVSQLLWCLACILIFVCTTNVQAQKQNTYALVVGISNYKNPEIEPLNYAHIDAAMFADFLKSKSGGQVPDSNIILLQNEKASYTAIYNALDWIVENARENDLIYFYFSGHGDMENTTIYKLGFLLSYNTPPTNYINNAVRIEDLNNYANTLSIKTRAKVILITDACHSGKLSGNDNKGTQLVGEQLRTVLNNETRIASCASDQLSAEDKSWGGGRGVFSYYLLNGLSGLADKSRDGKVYLDEISQYLNQSFKTDIILKQRDHKQNPIVKGSEKFPLSTVDSAMLKKLLAQQKADSADVQPFTPLSKSLQAYFFDEIENNQLETKINFIELLHTPAEELTSKIISDKLAHLQDSLPIAKLTALLEEIKTKPSIKTKFNRKLIETISDRGQDIINAYLNGDEAELEKRRYYNNINNEFLVYPAMFDIAHKLCENTSPLKKILEIKKYYFNAVYHRIQALKVTNIDDELKLAIENINKAIELDRNAAYLHNELGVIYKYKKDYNQAEACFKLAIKIAPNWALPYSNLASNYFAQKQIPQAKEYIKKAENIQPDLFYVLLNRGRLFETENNYLFAEQKYRTIIRKNSRHYFPFERLGYIYITKGNYVLADSFFAEAEIRKHGLNYGLPDIDGDGFVDVATPSFIIPKCNIPKLIADNDVITPFVLGYYHSYGVHDSMYDLEKAVSYFKMAIERDQNNPLAFHYLGKLYWSQKEWQKANEYLAYAITLYLNNSMFTAQADSLSKFITQDRDCFLQRYKQCHYSAIEDFFLLGDALCNWKHYDEAENIYKKAISFDSNYVGAYYKLWNLYEQQGKYFDAEICVQTFAKRNTKQGLWQLNAFYERAAKTQQATWYYKAGLHFYTEALSNAELYSKECISNLPNEEIDPKCSIDQAMDISQYAGLLPGTSEHNEPGIDIRNPKQKAIDYFIKADELLHLDDDKADVNNKIGDMYILLNSTLNAAKYYQKSFYYKNENASCASKLIDALNTNYQFIEATPVLDTLQKRGQLNRQHLKLNLSYKIFSGELNAVPSILDNIQQLQAIPDKSLARSVGFYLIMKKDYLKAQQSFEAYHQENKNEANALYDLARTALLQNNTAGAYNYLNQCAQQGLKIPLVLKYDEVWEKERNNGNFQHAIQLMSN